MTGLRRLVPRSFSQRAAAAGSIAIPERRPQPNRGLPRGLILSLLLHSLPLLSLIGWRSTPAEIPSLVPIQLVIEQPPPPPPPPVKAEPTPSPPQIHGASADLAEVATPKTEQGTSEAHPTAAEPQPPAAAQTSAAEPQPPTPAKAAAGAPPQPEPAPAGPQPTVEAQPPAVETKTVAPPVPAKQPPHKEPATIRMASAWPLPLRQDHPHEAQRSASLIGPNAMFDEYCAHALSLTMRHADLLPLSYLGARRGKTVLTIRILGDGTVNSVRVAESSGYPDIDQRIERMVFSVGQYPPLPPRMPGSWMDFTFIMIFPDAAQR